MTPKQTFTALFAAFSLLLASCTLPESGPGEVVPLLEKEASASGPGEKTEIRVVTLLEWLKEPWGMDFLPDGSILITEKPGIMKVVTPGSWQTRQVKGLPEVANEGQGGLLDVLVHPDFARNQWVYFSYSVALGDGFTTRVSRGRLQGDTLVELEDLFTALPAYPQRRHFGSRLLLDSGYLYITVGDRGRRDPAQDLLDHSGKVLRLTEAGAFRPAIPLSATRMRGRRYTPTGIAIPRVLPVIHAAEKYGCRSTGRRAAMRSIFSSRGQTTVGR